MAEYKQKTVASTTAIVDTILADVTLTGALLGGTDAMRKAGQTYLPKWPKEEEEPYKHRLATSVLFPAFKRTVKTLAAKPLSKPLTLSEDLPDTMIEWLKDVDLQGRNLDAFVATLLEEALGPGLCGVFVEYSKADTVQRTESGATTQAAEKAAGLRSYFVLVRAKQFLGWRANALEGKWQLTMVRFMETVQENDGEYGTADIAQVRVLEIGKWRTFRKDKERDVWVEYESGTTTLDFIPFVPVYGEFEEFMVGRPPLKEVAHLNVKHWQSQSDQDTILHVARVPMMVVIGIEENPKKPFEVVVGASTAVKLPMNADLKYVEHTGAAIDAGKVSLDDLKEEMRQAGAELLVLRPGPATATEVASDNAVGMCTLQQITLSTQDAVCLMIDYMAAWTKEELKKGEPMVKLFTDFGAATLAEASLQLLLSMATAGKLSDETLHSEAQRRGVLSADVSWKDEQERIESQGPAPGEDEFGNPLIEVDPLTGKPKVEVDPLTGKPREKLDPLTGLPIK